MPPSAAPESPVQESADGWHCDEDAATAHASEDGTGAADQTEVQPPSPQPNGLVRQKSKDFTSTGDGGRPMSALSALAPADPTKPPGSTRTVVKIQSRDGCQNDPRVGDTLHIVVVTHVPCGVCKDDSKDLQNT